jgi:UDP-3-O-[3-hydroxymyristoyl] glucosamine N-acyltransferase
MFISRVARNNLSTNILPSTEIAEGVTIGANSVIAPNAMI